MLKYFSNLIPMFEIDIVKRGNRIHKNMCNDRRLNWNGKI